jgi:hypothetical protein
MSVMLCSLLFAAAAVAPALGSNRAASWQTGTFHLEGEDNGGWKGSGVSAARHAPGNLSDDPLNETVFFDITSESGTYRAALTVLLVDESVSYEELLPWLRNLRAAQVRFRTKRKALYFLDSASKQHKADIVGVLKPHS